jgi:hypothetical protein
MGPTTYSLAPSCSLGDEGIFLIQYWAAYGNPHRKVSSKESAYLAEPFPYCLRPTNLSDFNLVGVSAWAIC